MSAPEQRRFAELFGGRRANSNLVGIAKAACQEGYAVLPVAAGDKVPVCTLTQRQAKQADKAAAEQARDRGAKHWERVRHPCGKHHAITDPAEAERVFKRLVEREPELNIGLEVGRSRLVVVDCDTLGEVMAFTEEWANRDSAPEMRTAAPTVRTPGKQSADGSWTHQDGGHFWFQLPEGISFEQSSVAATMPIGGHHAKAHVMFHNALALVPPSVRAEGPYVMASDVFPCPQWLIDDLLLHVEGHQVRRDRHVAVARDGSDPIDVWSAATSWEQLLSGDGWTSSGRPDQCGCAIWTRPGDWSSPKSATAHEPGCIRWDTEAGHGFLHIWTYSPPSHIADYIAATGKTSLSKLQYVAWRDHGGDVGAAMAELGIQAAGGEPEITDDEVFERVRVESEKGKKEDPPIADEVDDDGGEPELTPFQKLRSEFISAADLDKIPPLEPLVDGILDLKTTTRVIGRSGHGKTFFMLDVAAHVVTGEHWHGRACRQGLVVYVVAEGAAGFTRRVRAWESHHGMELGDGLQVLPRPVQAANVTEWAVLVEVLREMGPVLVVIDTQARCSVGMEENSAKDMGLFVDRADRIKNATGACVVLVHHQGHAGDQGRGSSAVLGALDAEVAVVKEARNRIAVLSSKQKDREDFDPMRFDLKAVEEFESGVLVPAGEGQDLLLGLETINMSARDRLAKIVYETFNRGFGGTKAEIKQEVRDRDRGSNGKPMSPTSFKRVWGELEAEGALMYVDTDAGKRIRLAHSEAVRLGFVDLDEVVGDDL